MTETVTWFDNCFVHSFLVQFCFECVGHLVELFQCLQSMSQLWFVTSSLARVVISTSLFDSMFDSSVHFGKMFCKVVKARLDYLVKIIR